MKFTVGGFVNQQIKKSDLIVIENVPIDESKDTCFVVVYVLSLFNNLHFWIKICHFIGVQCAFGII